MISHTPILDSGILPPRVRRSSRVGAVAGLVVVLFTTLILAKAVDEQASRNSNTGLGLLLFLAAFSVAVLIHELGHLAAGWALGFRFSLISVGPLALHLEQGKLKVSFLREMTAFGYSGMHIDRLVRLRRRVVFYAAAGPVANLATVPLAVMFANDVFRIGTPVVYFFCCPASDDFNSLVAREPSSYTSGLRFLHRWLSHCDAAQRY